MNKDNAVNIGKININSIEWYVPDYKVSIQQETILMNHMVTKTSTELKYVERSVFMKQVNTHRLWTFELGIQEGVNVPIWIIISCQQRDGQNLQNLNNDTFLRPPVTSVQCALGTEKNTDPATLLNRDDDEYN